MNDTWLTALALSPHPFTQHGYLFAQENVGTATANFFENTTAGFASFLPNLLGAIAILIIGWLLATIVASVVKGLLKRTEIDNRLGRWVTGRDASEDSPPVEKWIAAVIYWLIIIFTLLAVFNALDLDIVSGPIENFLGQIFSYIPKVGGALLLLGLAWVIATVARLAITRGLARFNLDDRLADQTGTSTSDSPFLINETLGNIVYWFIFLIFLPLILEALDLQDGTLGPIQNLIDEVLSVLPNIFGAILIGLIGWIIARVVRGIVTNLLASMGADRLGERFGLSGGTSSGTTRTAATAGTTGTTSDSGLQLSKLVGTVVYVLILIPVAIEALNTLDIDAISDPATNMLELAITFIPRIFAAALIMVAFYVVGRFLSELATTLLTSIGFNRVFEWLGLHEIQRNVQTEPQEPVVPPVDPNAEFGSTPGVTTRTTSGSQSLNKRRTPSEIVGISILIGTLIVGAVAASDALGFEQLTNIFQAVLAVALRVLSGVVVFAIGLYFANLAFSLISSTGSSQSRILAQTARIAIIGLVSAMALQQMGVATNIVNLAFGLLLGAIAVAIAIAFGLGGRDIASEEIRGWLNSFKSRQ
ncbi:MAG: mechanosensitive ion channel [Elainellaceae cyanobacterium]